MYLWIILMLFCVFVDQISKYLVVIYMDLGESVDLIPEVFRFTYIRNEGAAFGSLSDSRWVFMVISTVAIVAILVYFFLKKPQSKLICTGISFIVGGGIGNMIDRVRLGYVVDFLDFCAFPSIWKYVFNVADALVCIGCGLILLWMILDLRREIIEEKAKNAALAVEAAADISTETDIVDPHMTDELAVKEENTDGTDETGETSEDLQNGDILTEQEGADDER